MIQSRHQLLVVLGIAWTVLAFSSQNTQAGTRVPGPFDDPDAWGLIGSQYFNSNGMGTILVGELAYVEFQGQPGHYLRIIASGSAESNGRLLGYADTSFTLTGPNGRFIYANGITVFGENEDGSPISGSYSVNEGFPVNLPGTYRLEAGSSSYGNAWSGSTIQGYTYVPEPSSLVLLTGGACTVIVVGRRRILRHRGVLRSTLRAASRTMGKTL